MRLEFSVPFFRKLHEFMNLHVCVLQNTQILQNTHRLHRARWKTLIFCGVDARETPNAS